MEELYKEIYAYPEVNINSIHKMVGTIFFKFWAARGNNINHMFAVLNDALPSENWKVGGKKFNFWYNKETDKFNNEETLWAQTLSMASYISNSEMTDVELAGEEEIKMEWEEGKLIRKN